MVSLGPLTTTFTPAPSCVASFSTDFKLPGGWDIMGPISTDGCFPSNYAFATNAYYSPGICPLGYTAACVSLSPGESVTDPVTTATCCPTGYTCNPSPIELSGSTYFCNTRISAFTGAQASMSGSVTLTTSTDYTIAASQGWIANAFGVQIQYKANDFASPTSSPSTSQIGSSVTPPPTSTPSESSSNIAGTSSDSGSTASKGLSTGASAGIGVGVGLAVLLIITVAFFAIRTRRRRARDRALANSAFYTQTASPYMIDSKSTPSELPVEVRQVPVGELEGSTARGPQH